MNLTPLVSQCDNHDNMDNEFGRTWSVKSPAFNGPLGMKIEHLGLIGERLSWSGHPFVCPTTFYYEAWHDCRIVPIVGELNISGEVDTFDEALQNIEILWMCSLLTPAIPTPYVSTRKQAA